MTIPSPLPPADETHTPHGRGAPHHRAALAASAAAGSGVYLGHDAEGWCFAPPQHCVLVLGPPRSGKTTSVLIPNVLASGGPVLSTSTKFDVLEATVHARTGLGQCHLFDPTGSTDCWGSLAALRWSPLQSSRSWTGAQSMARCLVTVGTRPDAGSSHWAERAQALLAPLLHAAAADGADMGTVLSWVDRRKALPARCILASLRGRSAGIADDLLDGIIATDEREQSGIWSTASGALAGFRTEEALASTAEPQFDASAFVQSADTIYVAAPGHRQALVASMIVGLIEDIRHATYALAADEVDRSARPPVLLALDELANVAPIPGLPSMISEGGGQGLVTLACLQDLSQARRRWPGEADGFPSLFGTTVVLPGIGDARTLEALSTIVGDEDVPVRSLTAGRTPTGRPLTDLATGGRWQVSESVGTQRRRRLPPDVIGRGAAGHALALDERNRASWVPLAPMYTAEPWVSITGPVRGAERHWARRHDVTLGR